MNYLASLARARAAFAHIKRAGLRKPKYIPGKGVGAPQPTDELVVMYRQVTYRRWSDGSLRKIEPADLGTVKGNIGAARGI